MLNETKVDQVWFVISPQNPLKKNSSLLNEYHRYNLVKTAIEAEHKFKASNIEFKLPKPSYTIDTLTYLKEKYPTHKFLIIMGSDSLFNINKWKNYKTLLKDYEFLIYNRPGILLPVYNQTNIKILNAPNIEISSTIIRNLIKEGKSINYLVPKNVQEEIERNNYYN